MNKQDICRTCMGSSDLSPLFPNLTKCDDFVETLHLTTGLKIQPNDGLPQMICCQCSQNVKNSMNFRLKTQEVHEKLMGYFNTSSDEASEVTFKIEIVKEIKIEKCAHTPTSPNESDDALSKIQEDKKVFDDNNTECKKFKFDTLPKSPISESDNEESFKKDFKIHNVKDTPESDPNFSSQRNLLHNEKDSDSSNEVQISIKKSRVDKPTHNESAENKYLKRMSKKETFERKRTLDLIEGPLKPKQPIQCKICKKFVKSFNGFEKHLMSHVGYNILCEFCGKTCMTISSLLRHQRAKHGLEKDNSFPCSYCDFKALDKEQLEVHERKQHTKERPYVCSDCGASFLSKRVLNQHYVNHKDDKPYQCAICPTKFKLRCSLTNHIKRVHDKNNRKYIFECHLCHKKYTSTGDTRKHLVKAHGIPTEQQGKIHRYYFPEKNPCIP